MEARVNNSLEQRNIRRSQSILEIVGAGIIMFAVWEAVKSFGVALLRRGQTMQDIMSDLPEETAEMTPGLAFILVIIITAIFVMLETVVRVYVGMSAIGEGRGKKKGRAYLVWTYVLIFLTLLAVLLEIAGVAASVAEDLGIAELETEGTTEAGVATALVIDLTSLIMMIEMLVSAYRVRRYKKLQNPEEADHAA